MAQGMTQANVKSGFQATGIYPVNRWKYKTARLDSVKLKSYNWWKSNGSQLDAEGDPDFTGYLPSPQKERHGESFCEEGIGANSTRLDEPITLSQASASASAANVSGSAASQSETVSATSGSATATVSGVNASIYKEIQKQAPPGMRYVLTLEPAETEVSFEAIIKSRGKPSSKPAVPVKRKQMSMHGQIITEPEFAEQLQQNAAEKADKEKKKQERAEAKKRKMKKTTKKPVKKVKSKAKPAKFSSSSCSDSDDEREANKKKRQKVMRKLVQSSSNSSSESDADSDVDNHAGNIDGEANGKTTLVALMKKCRASLDDHSVGGYLAVYYLERHHWGKLIKVFSQDPMDECDKVEVKFLKPRPNNFYDWGKGIYILYKGGMKLG